MIRMSFGKTLIAFLIILAGILLILVNTNVISGEIMSTYESYLPILFVFFVGLWYLFRPILNGKRSHWLFGIFLIVYSSLLFLNNLHVIAFTWDSIWLLWPFLIIYLGISLLKGEPFVRIHFSNKKAKWEKDHTVKSSKSNFISDSCFNEDNWLVEPITRQAKIANINMDFTKAFIPDVETPITYHGWVGDIHITLPEDLPFSLEATPSIGEVKIGGYKQANIGQGVDYKTELFDAATRRIKFRFDFHVLNLRIDRV